MACFSDKMTTFVLEFMNRTFHHKVSWLNISGIVAVAGAALCFFCHRSAANAAAGLVLLLACVLMIERILHTVYVFTADGLLVINRGRFSRQTVIHVSDILSAEKLRAGVLPVRYVLVRYGAGHEVAVQPVNKDAFIGEIRRRQQETESDFEKQ